MSERMTDEEAAAADKAITAAGWVSSNGVGAKIRADWLRARASEAEKDAVVKALEEVLNKCRTQARGTNLEDEINAALRLAGRL